MAQLETAVSLSFRFLLCFLATSIMSEKTCYHPGRSIIDTESTPCNLAAEVSHCCRVDQVCLNNGYCFGGQNWGNIMTRESCTDLAWQSSACPVHCIEGECCHTLRSLATDLDYTNSCFWQVLTGKIEPTDNGIAIVPAVLADISKFCCGEGYNVTSGDCASENRGSRSPFQIPNGQIISNRSSGSTEANVTSTVQTMSATVTVTSERQISSGSRDAAIGIGVGVPLGTILLVVSGFLWWQVRQRRILERRLKAGFGPTDSSRRNEELSDHQELQSRNAPDLPAIRLAELR